MTYGMSFPSSSRAHLLQGKLCILWERGCWEIQFQTLPPLPVLSEALGSSYRLGCVTANAQEARMQQWALLACFRGLMASWN